MTHSRVAPEVVHGDDLCIRDPGGDDRARIDDTADHAPPSDPDALDAMLAPVDDVLLGTAGLQPGERVLDIGCGTGATALAAAAAVLPDGLVHGIDITPAGLAIARRRVNSTQLRHVTFTEADAQGTPLPTPADVAISRFGTMFFTDPVAAFTNIRSALRPGGRLCIATWQPLDMNAWLIVLGAALLPWITLPDVDGEGPGMFSQSDPSSIARVLEAAGFEQIDVRGEKLALTIGPTVEAAAARLSDTGVGRAALDAVPDEHRPDAMAAVHAALADHATETGVHLGAAIFITTAAASR